MSENNISLVALVIGSLLERVQIPNSVIYLALAEHPFNFAVDFVNLSFTKQTIFPTLWYTASFKRLPFGRNLPVLPAIGSIPLSLCNVISTFNR